MDLQRPTVASSGHWWMSFKGLTCTMECSSPLLKARVQKSRRLSGSHWQRGEWIFESWEPFLSSVPRILRDSFSGRSKVAMLCLLKSILADQLNVNKVGAQSSPGVFRSSFLDQYLNSQYKL
jgi:hypothetical protein